MKGSDRSRGQDLTAEEAPCLGLYAHRVEMSELDVYIDATIAIEWSGVLPCSCGRKTKVKKAHSSRYGKWQVSRGKCLVAIGGCSRRWIRFKERAQRRVRIGDRGAPSNVSGLI